MPIHSPSGTHNLFPLAHFTVIAPFLLSAFTVDYSMRFPHRNSTHTGLHPGLISTTHTWTNNLLTPQTMCVSTVS